MPLGRLRTNFLSNCLIQDAFASRKILTADWFVTRLEEVLARSGLRDFECKRDFVSELTIPFTLKVPANLRFARTSSSRDPHRIQTCNLLIRSQMLYSVELAGLVVFLLFVLHQSELLLLDSCLLARKCAEVEDSCATNFTNLVNLDRFNERRVEWENPLDSDTV